MSNVLHPHLSELSVAMYSLRGSQATPCTKPLCPLNNASLTSAHKHRDGQHPSDLTVLLHCRAQSNLPEETTLGPSEHWSAYAAQAGQWKTHLVLLLLRHPPGQAGQVVSA